MKTWKDEQDMWEIELIKRKMDPLTKKFIDDHIDQPKYSEHIKQLDDQLIEFKHRLYRIESQELQFNINIKKGITLVENLKEFYRSASTDVKQKIIGSIFP